MNKNFYINDTFLGKNEHGVFTFYLHISDGSLHGSFGGVPLDYYDEGDGKRIITKKGALIIQKILEVVGVDSWEDLKGKYCRIEMIGDGGILSKAGTRIMNILDDSNSFDYSELFKKEKA